MELHDNRVLTVLLMRLVVVNAVQLSIAYMPLLRSIDCGVMYAA